MNEIVLPRHASERHAGVRNRWMTLLMALCLCLATAAVAEDEQTIPALPDTLGQWYKPANKRQVWLHTMFSLRREMQAVAEYAEAKEPALLLKWSQKFITHFRSIPEMVPEWRDEVELAEATRLQAAAESADFKSIGPILSRLQRDCRSCHREFRALAALRYRTADFSQLKVQDIETGPTDYSEYMDGLSASINRIKIASEDSRWDRAKAASSMLRRQLHQLGESCETCHDDPSPRNRILGDTTLGVLDALDGALQDQQPRNTGMKLGEAAVVICARCHGIHRTLSDVRHFLYE